ncbi:16S rRNA (cytidine(1402)-2'-O)-methyltransferase [Phormidium sp. CCY1219]|uniref:16S rRNA (cytidine(1402)-2'-O)-methyltransferase n=1 Tax=Phormidium sp. CCY1219 TaxID=2886104 RepID=UPI002D1EF310|nr:16S rRNA (cytidine(1402)-2'-O)-methyltransferase [Phormidium sp. CCY1219]MEB3829496.1 16S rRNA (cytidine(1402)-2'-O)-methyltransferase [Phormidium sp. CCY1219]
MAEKRADGDRKRGILYIVGTPIGNLEDMTFRGVRILREVEAIAAEDTRHTGKLLQHFEITTPQISYHEHNRKQRMPELVDRLQGGSAIALVTDAGMPGISDPGFELIQACGEGGISVVPIPGPTACITALVGAGLPGERFVFEGFLPVKGKARQQRLEALQGETRTMILYEAPHRVRKTLTELGEALGGDRAIVLGRELTKLHEEFWRGSIAEAIAHYGGNCQPKGEFTLVITGRETAAPAIGEQTLKAELQNLINRGMSRSQATKHLAQHTALPRRQIYQLALTIGEESE